jgi:hypothetical protein
MLQFKLGHSLTRYRHPHDEAAKPVLAPPLALLDRPGRA